ncbi:MAG: ParA family protein, partial [Chloroflexia bacterium]
VEEAITPIDRPIFGGRLDLLPANKKLSGAEIELAEEAQGERENLMRDILNPLRSHYDYILIDCPPSLGLITVNTLVAADAVVIPLQCEYLALEGLVQLRETISLVLKGLNRNLGILGIVMTMYDARTNLSESVVNEVQTYYPREIFNTRIPRSVRLSEAPSYSLSILEYDPNSRGALAYAALASEIAARSGDTFSLTMPSTERSVAS